MQQRPASNATQFSDPPCCTTDAGVYVPTLAEAILHAMQAETYSGAPLAGIAVGNGCSGTEIGVCGGQGEQFRTEFLTEHAFMPRSLKNTIRAECDWKAARQSEACKAALGEMGTTIGHIDLYNVYGPCIDGSRPTAGAAEPERGQAETLAVNTHGRLQTASQRPALTRRWR